MCAAVTRAQAVDVHLASAVAVGASRTVQLPPRPPTAVTAPVAEVPQPGPDDGATPVYAQHNTADAPPGAVGRGQAIARR